MLLRRISRPLLASWFVIQGTDAARHPAEHAQRGGPLANAVAARLGVPRPLEPREIRTAARLHGAAVTLCALGLAVGRRPRACAAALALLSAPLVVEERYWSAEDPAVRRRLREQFFRDLAIVGGLLAAAADSGGKPSLGWRAHRRAEATVAKIR